MENWDVCSSVNDLICPKLVLNTGKIKSTSTYSTTYISL